MSSRATDGSNVERQSEKVGGESYCGRAMNKVEIALTGFGQNGDDRLLQCFRTH